MKLYSVPRDCRIRVGYNYLNFHKIDGMYSHCTTDSGEVVHLSAMTEVEVIEKLKPQIAAQ